MNDKGLESDGWFEFSCLRQGTVIGYKNCSGPSACTKRSMSYAFISDET